MNPKDSETKLDLARMIVAGVLKVIVWEGIAYCVPATTCCMPQSIELTGYAALVAARLPLLIAPAAEGLARVNS